MGLFNTGNLLVDMIDNLNFDTLKILIHIIFLLFLGELLSQNFSMSIVILCILFF